VSFRASKSKGGSTSHTFLMHSRHQLLYSL